MACTSHVEVMENSSAPYYDARSKAAAWAWYMRSNPDVSKPPCDQTPTGRRPPTGRSVHDGRAPGYSRFRPQQAALQTCMHTTNVHQRQIADDDTEDCYGNDSHARRLASRRCSRQRQVCREMEHGSVQEQSKDEGDEHSIAAYSSNLLDSFELKHLVWELQSRDIVLFPSTPNQQFSEQACSGTALPHSHLTSRSSCCISTFTLHSPCYIALFHIFKHLKRVAKLAAHAKQYVS